MKLPHVVPPYDCGPLLRAARQTIQHCAWDGLEIIVRDGAKRDDTVSQVEDRRAIGQRFIHSEPAPLHPVYFPVGDAATPAERLRDWSASGAGEWRQTTQA